MSRSAISANRKATNISLDMSLLEQARAFNINISRACERGLAEQIAESRAKRWRAEKAEALASSNRYVERNGLHLSDFRPVGWPSSASIACGTETAYCWPDRKNVGEGERG